MPATRKLTGAFAATFVIGVAVGALVMWDVTDTKASDFIKRTSNADSLALRIEQKYQSEYNLTPDEQDRIKPLVEEMARSLVDIRHKFGVDVIAALDEYHARIADQMTPEHRAAFIKANEDRKKRMTAMLLPEQTQGQ